MVLMVTYIIAVLACTIPLFSLAQDTERWRPTTGFVSDNTIDKRTITYSVGRKSYTTINESIIDLLGQQVGMEFHFRPGQSKTKINGVDPEIGLSVPMFYNPHKPAEAVVLKGWSMPAIVFMFVLLIPMFIRALAFFGMGWDPYQHTTPHTPGT